MLRFSDSSLIVADLPDDVVWLLREILFGPQQGR